jgi:glycosyltransferase involved in cell wall biosynthesis
MMQRQLALAQQLEKRYTVIACHGERDRVERGVEDFQAITDFTFPEFPSLKLHTPPLLQVLRHCYEVGYTHLHLATPGPVGLSGLAVARILGLPVSGTYHASIPVYGKELTEDSYVEDTLWKYMVWFYGQMDEILVPSWAAANDLLERGIGRDRIKVHPRGCDIAHFHPDRASNILAEKYGIDDDRVNFLYVGRIAREKGLRILQQAFLELVGQGVNARLILAGDGPYLPEMKAALEGTPVLFTGYVPSDELAEIYASADCFVFPSTTDTIGNVVLKAQASGIPVIVTDKGGPQENMLADETGLVVEAHNTHALTHAMRTLACDRDLRQRMGAAGRLFMQDKDFTACFEALYSMYTDRDAAQRISIDLEKGLKAVLMTAAV